MTLLETVHERVLFNGRTPGGCQLVLNNLLDCGRDVFQFMRLFSVTDVNKFYFSHQEEIDNLCNEDEELLDGLYNPSYTKLALEKCLMLIEQEINVSCES